MERKIWILIRLTTSCLVLWFGIACGSPMSQIIIEAILIFAFDIFQYFIDD